METDPIENLLRQADASAPVAPAGASRLAAGARAAHRRRQRRAATATLAVIFAMITAGIFALHRPRPHPIALKSPGIPTTVIAITETDWNAKDAAQTKTVALMLAAERHTSAARRLNELNHTGSAVDWLHEQREQSALAVLEEVASVPGGADRPIIYRQVIDLFPGTGAAVVARERLTMAQ